MRLQSAIFVVESAVSGHADAEKLLSLLRFEGVWLYAVTGMERTEAERVLASCGAAGHFRAILSAHEANCALSEPALFKKAIRRLRSLPRDTAVFAGDEASLRAAREAGARTVAVAGFADAAEWARMCALADEIVERYADYFH